MPKKCLITIDEIETTQGPEKTSFYSDLSDTGFGDEEQIDDSLAKIIGNNRLFYKVFILNIVNVFNRYRG